MLLATYYSLIDANLLSEMALFQKKQDASNSAPLYTLSADKTYLIIGLGNPGKDYRGTRHNVGFEVIDFFAAKNDFSDFSSKKDLKCEFTSSNIGGAKVILIKPTTFMNNSGQAAKAVQHFYKIGNSNTLAVYDELALPFSQLRTRVGGTDAGHNGVKSLIQHLGDGFGRLRIGIASEKIPADSSSYVLKKFSKEEQVKLPNILREANELINEFVIGETLPHNTRTVL